MEPLHYLPANEPLLARASNNPTLPKIPHNWGKAKNVIFLFMEGGPSHLDLFDPKPLLNKLAGKPLPNSFDRPVTAMGEVNSPLLESKRTWKQHGESGLWISDWLPNHSRIADELLRDPFLLSDGINHAGGVCQMNTGSVFGGRPSLDHGYLMGLVRKTKIFRFRGNQGYQCHDRQWYPMLGKRFYARHPSGGSFGKRT